MKKLLDLVFRNSIKDTALKRVFFEDTISESLKVLGLDKQNIEISVNIVGNAKIRSLNNKYRGKNKSTDVLSFPLIDGPISQTPQAGAIINLGDIFISLPFVIRKVDSDKKILKDELTLLTVHGFLHLLGYDHESSRREERTMLNLQDRILKRLHE